MFRKGNSHLGDALYLANPDRLCYAVTVRVADIMSRDPVTIRADEPAERAAREMAAGGFRHLPVTDAAGTLVGILSERDLLRAGGGGLRVRDAMQADVETVSPQTAAHEAAYLLLRRKIGCVPVVDDGALVGIVTESDFVRIAYTLLGGQVPIDQLLVEERESSRD